MTSTKIKFCGMMRPQDAAAAAEAGADAIGMIFYPEARRFIPRELAREIIIAVPPTVSTVGVFVNADAETIRSTAQDLGLEHVQLHGDETIDLVDALAPLRVVKVIRVKAKSIAEDLGQWRRAIRDRDLSHVVGLLLEADGGAEFGGSGVANDWETLAALRAAGGLENLPPLIAAGGLTPDNVGGVVHLLRPSAVDVSSGIEARLGEKSAEKMAAFVAAVRAAE